ncbi:MAG: hypothetical protein JWP67_1193 [Mucilaginibacter sp.]|nr:hypothetical protein [Mucilaginibacter sp.]
MVKQIQGPRVYTHFMPAYKYVPVICGISIEPTIILSNSFAGITALTIFAL